MRQLHVSARIVLLLNALYHAAEGLCAVFVGVYLYRSSLDFQLVCWHYLVLYAVVPFVFIGAGWYAQRFDRVHVFRLGLLMHAAYYALILYLQEDAAEHAIALGALLGVTWGFFWAGNNVFTFDVASKDYRDYYFGWLSASTGFAQWLGPVIGGVIIGAAAMYWGEETGLFGLATPLGYQIVFGCAVLIYLVSFVITFWVPPDNERRPFRPWRALFPGRDQRDWQLVMVASASMAGNFSIFNFLLGLIMFVQTDNEFTVGIYTGVQAVIGIVVSLAASRYIQPRNRKQVMLWSTLILMAGGALILFKLDVLTLVFFGLFRSAAMPLFTIPYSSVRFDVIDRSVRNPEERIEYICAWEVPLATGRIIMMTLMIALSGWLVDNDLGIRIALFCLCANRIISYAVMAQTSVMKVDAV